jgi:hypothetical protein
MTLRRLTAENLGVAFKMVKAIGPCATGKDGEKWWCEGPKWPALGIASRVSRPRCGVPGQAGQPRIGSIGAP